MCDYSLYNVPNRLARDGEQLVAHMFCTGTIGLVAVEPAAAPVSASDRPWWRQSLATWLSSLSLSSRLDLCAICVPPGARLVLRDIPPRLRAEFGVGAEEEVSFTQVGNEAYHYRDAIRFSNGRELLLQRLRVGQRVDVLSIALIEETERTAGQTAATIVSGFESHDSAGLPVARRRP